MCLIEKSNKTRLIEHPLNALCRTPAVSSSCKWPKCRDTNGKTNGTEGGERAVTPNTPFEKTRQLADGGGKTQNEMQREVRGWRKTAAGFGHFRSCQENSGGAAESATQAWALQLAWELFAVLSALWARKFMSTDGRAKKQEETADGFILTLLESNHNKIHNMLTIGLGVKARRSITGRRTDATRGK